MDDKILAYRKKHKGCRYCKYCEYYETYYNELNFVIEHCICELKDKEIFGHGMRGRFCKWYEPEEG